MRLVGKDGNQIGIVPRSVALAEAKKDGMDLVLIAPDSTPPVCKVLDYGKHIFDLKKTRAAQKRKQRQTQVKEIKFRPGTDEADYQIKLRNLERFLTDGDKAKISMRFRGREMQHPELGMKVLKRVEEDLSGFGAVEMSPKIEGRQMIMIIAPHSRKRK